MWTLNFAQHSKTLLYMVFMLIQVSDNEWDQHNPQQQLDRQRYYQSCTEHHQVWWEWTLETVS